MMIMIFNLFCRIPIKFLKPKKKKKKKTQHNKLTQKQEKHFKKKIIKEPISYREREREREREICYNPCEDSPCLCPCCLFS